uniref:Transthyretin/hydroxyisourate hydrolase domain-containing protein n=1 Tax=Bos mutus grunniens TaxID=30521 RepID=A0A8B9WZB0_BOSMU
MPNPPTSLQFPALSCRAIPISPLPVLVLSTVLKSLCGPAEQVGPLCCAPPTLPSCTELDDCCPWLLPSVQMKALTCNLSFDTEGYWKKRGQESFFPHMGIIFTIGDETYKFHGLPVLSPWSYPTYLGS